MTTAQTAELITPVHPTIAERVSEAAGGDGLDSTLLDVSVDAAGGRWGPRVGGVRQAEFSDGSRIAQTYGTWDVVAPCDEPVSL